MELPGANEYCAWETQPPPAARASPSASMSAGVSASAARGARLAQLQAAPEPEPEPEAQLPAVPAGDDDIMVQLLMEQLGQAPTVMLGTYYSEKLAVDIDIPDEAGGNLSIMQDPGSEQRGHGEAGGVVWKCAGTMCHHLCDRCYFPEGYWEGKRCLEIGAGTGLLGLAAARLGAQVVITDYGELSELIAHNIKRNLSEEQQAVTSVDSLDWNQKNVAERFPPEKWDVILISDVVWADGYGRLPQTLTEIAMPGSLILLGFETRGHKRPELGSPTFIPTLGKWLDVTEVEFPAEFQREHLHLYHVYNTSQPTKQEEHAQEPAVEQKEPASADGDSSGSDGFDSA